MVKNCPNCGKMVPGNANVCPNCNYEFHAMDNNNQGNTIQQNVYPQQPMQPMQPGYPQGGNNGMYNPYPGGNPKRDNSKTMLYVIIGILAILIVVGVIVWLCTRPREKETIYVQVPATETPYAGDMNTAAPAAPATPAPEPAPVVEEPKPKKPQIVNGQMYLKGKVDGKYAVAMYIDLTSGRGKYCYTKYGAKKSMTLYVNSEGPVNNPSVINMTEYNPDGEYCGEWSGVYSNGKYSGTGEFHGSYMPFSLRLVNRSETPY